MPIAPIVPIGWRGQPARSKTRPPANRAKLLIAVLVGLVMCATTTTAQPARCIATDGDSLRCGSLRVRVVGLDAPEMRARCPREAQLARAATDRLSALVAGGVRLHPQGRDRYGRTLAVVLDARGRDVANEMIRAGVARPYDGQSRRGGWC